jgi:hypothetical protein
MHCFVSLVRYLLQSTTKIFNQLDCRTLHYIKLHRRQNVTQPLQEWLIIVNVQVGSLNIYMLVYRWVVLYVGYIIT